MSGQPIDPVPDSAIPDDNLLAIEQVQERLAAAPAGPALLAAAHGAFVLVLAECRAHENPADAWFATLVMTAAHAANGRDAISFAPSFAHSRLGASAVPTVSVDLACGGRPSHLAALSHQLAAQLARAAKTGPASDRLAYSEAAQCARRVGDLLSGTVGG